MKEEKKIAFLFGAGASLPAGISSTKEITERVLSGKNVKLHSDETFFIDDENQFMDHFKKLTPRITHLLSRIKVEIDIFYNFDPKRPTNYEDIYYILQQLSESNELFLKSNPLSKRFKEHIYSDILPLLSRKKERPSEETVEYENKIGLESFSDLPADYTLDELIKYSINYIRDIVWNMLYKQSEQLNYLQFLADALSKKNVCITDIFTLNHDNVLDTFFKKSKIDFIDGFGQSEDNVRYWNPLLLNGSVLRLIKLHGAINWIKFVVNENGKKFEKIGQPVTKDWNIKKQTPPGENRPVFLVGSGNKAIEYYKGIYYELHYSFYKALEQVQFLICCGYGFGDTGINTKIDEWLNSNSSRKLVIIHAKPTDLPISTKQNNIEVIEKWIENVSWTDIFSKLK